MTTIKNAVKTLWTPLRYYLIEAFYKNALKIYWFRGERNFGDSIAPLLVQRLTGKGIVFVDTNRYSGNNYLVIGSILHHVNKYSIVWGAGFTMADGVYGQCPEKPLKICAVRGPKTRNALLSAGINCPEVYGDPALLFPKIYLPNIKKKYKLGIVPHYLDKNSELLKILSDRRDVRLLDVQQKDPFRFVDSVLECERIASSSLHGIIISDAYGIPSVWIRLSDEIIGGDFKYLDYFASVGRTDNEALVIEQHTTIRDIDDRFYDYEIKIDLDLLLRSCPF